MTTEDILLLHRCGFLVRIADADVDIVFADLAPGGEDSPLLLRPLRLFSSRLLCDGKENGKAANLAAPTPDSRQVR